MKENFKNFTIMDCAVRSNNYLYLVASHTYSLEDSEHRELEDDGLREAIRIAVFFPNKSPEKKWAFRTIRNIEFMSCAVSNYPCEQLISVSMDGQVFAVGSGTADLELSIPDHRKGPLRGNVSEMVAIDGFVYAVQGNRGLCRRKAPNNWESFCLELPVSDTRQKRRKEGFNCASGTSESNIYAGGGHGDLWHFNGSFWKQLKFPNNVIIETLCCASENDVYVGCQSGIVYRGNGESWKKISDGGFSLPFKKMVVYQDKVWCTSDYGVWTIDGDRIQKAEIPPNAYVKSGCIAAKGNILLIAGMNGASYYDGNCWHDFLNLI